MGMAFYTRNARVEVSTYAIDGLMNYLTRIDLNTDWMNRDYEPPQMEGLIREIEAAKRTIAKKDNSERYPIYIGQLDDIIDFIKYCQNNRVGFKHGY